MITGKQSAGSVFVGLLIAIASVPVVGWVISVLWRWFVVPLHVPSIGVAHAMGLVLLLGAFRPSKPENNTEDKTVLSLALTAMLTPLLILALGALVHWFAS